MFECSVDAEFKGPVPPLLSSRIGFQEGDFQPNSSCSIAPQTPKPLQRTKTMGLKKSEYQSQYENEEDQFASKPQFLKLIIAKSLQTNFINNLWNRSYLRKLHQLSHFQIQQLDDLQLQSEGNDLNKSIWLLIDVFTPYSKFIVIWDVFQILTYLLIFFWLPYKISFEIYYISELISSNKSAVVEYFLMAILALDIGVGMNLAFIYKGQIIKDRRKIQQKLHFIFVVSFFTVTVQFFVPSLSSKDQTMVLIQTSLCLIFYILRITKINKILAQIQEFFNLSGYWNDLVGLFKVLMVIVSVVHIFGCIWHGIAHYNSSYSWLDAYNLREKSNPQKFNVAIYWATMTMTTVGYGDITAKNDLELLMNNLTMFIGSIVFAYSVNSIGIFVSNMYKGTMEYSRTVSLINTFMTKNKIQFDLQTKIRSYLEYIWQEEQEMNDDEVGSIVQKLSKHLQDELQYQLRGNILKSCKIIVKTFSEPFLKSLLHYMEEQSYSPEERIISINETDDAALYIITKGEVEFIFEGTVVQQKVKKNSFKNFTQYQSFGELEFFTGRPRAQTAVSRGFTRVFKIKRSNFLNLIQSFPDDYEKFCQIRDRVEFGDYQALQLNCFSCQSHYHLIGECNYLHFCADKEKVIKKEYFPFDQRRNRGYTRGYLGKQHPWVNLKLNQTRAQDFDAQIRASEEIDSHTLPMNDAYEEDDELEQNQDIRSLMNQKSVSGSILYNVEEVEGKGIVAYQRKTNQPKGTVQTAGFGGLRESVHKEEIQTSSENSSENQDQVVILPKLSLQQNTQVSQIPAKPISRPSFKKQLSRSASNDEYNIYMPRQSMDLKHVNQKSDMEIKFATANPQQNNRAYIKRTTTNQNATLVTDNTQLLQHQSVQSVAPMLPGFDKMHTFQIYQPLYNYDTVIKRYAKVQRFFGKKRLYPEFSMYAFLFSAIKKGFKLRRLGELSRQAKTPGMRSQRKIGKPNFAYQYSQQKSNFFKEVN